MKKLFENLNYFVLILLIVGQCTIGANWVVGQCIYLGANLISVSRCWILGRPVADKIKDCACLGITLGLLGFRLLGGFPFQGSAVGGRPPPTKIFFKKDLTNQNFSVIIKVQKGKENKK